MHSRWFTISVFIFLLIAAVPLTEWNSHFLIKVFCVRWKNLSIWYEYQLFWIRLDKSCSLDGVSIVTISQFSVLNDISWIVQRHLFQVVWELKISLKKLYRIKKRSVLTAKNINKYVDYLMCLMLSLSPKWLWIFIIIVELVITKNVVDLFQSIFTGEPSHYQSIPQWFHCIVKNILLTAHYINLWK